MAALIVLDKITCAYSIMLYVRFFYLLPALYHLQRSFISLSMYAYILQYPDVIGMFSKLPNCTSEFYIKSTPFRIRNGIT